VTGSELDRAVRAELSSLAPPAAKDVSRHLVMAGRLLDEDPETAYLHASYAREHAARLPGVREAVGLAAYRTGRFAEALSELRTVRRLTGSNEHLPVMADCERGLGRPERALALLASPEAAALDPAGRAEMLIVGAGARADLGELEAAVVMLAVPQLQLTSREPWVARLRSAYADALDAVGRTDEARTWLERAAESDLDGSTAAADRLAELDGTELVDLEEDGDDGDEGDEPVTDPIEADDELEPAEDSDGTEDAADLDEDAADVDEDAADLEDEDEDFNDEDDEDGDEERAPTPVDSVPAPVTLHEPAGGAVLFVEPPARTTAQVGDDD